MNATALIAAEGDTWSFAKAEYLATLRALLPRQLVPGGEPHMLGGVDKFEPVSGGGDVDHAEEAVGKLVVAGGDGAVDLEVAEHALDAVALLVERPVMLDLHASV